MVISLVLQMSTSYFFLEMKCWLDDEFVVENCDLKHKEMLVCHRF